MNWIFIKECLAVRREKRKMERLGYINCEPVWEIVRGQAWKKNIIDVKISVTGKHVWVKVG